MHSNPIMFTDPTGHIEIGEAEEASKIVTDLKYNYQIEIVTDWGTFEQGTNRFLGLLPTTVQYLEANGFGCGMWHEGMWTMKDLKALQAGVHIMDRGVSFLGGDFKSLIGIVAIEQFKSYNTQTSTTGPGKIYWRYQNNDSQEYGLYTTVHEMGHIVAFHQPKTMSYFMKQLETKCSNHPWWSWKVPYCNKDQGKTVSYNAGPYKGTPSNGYGYTNMPSEYATHGNYEDYAETWREVVVKAYIDSGDTAWINEAKLLYDAKGYNFNHSIGQRRTVMESIINGSWK